jgi:hypothetical protein
MRRLKGRRNGILRSTDVRTLDPQTEETQVSGSYWDDGRTLVVAIPMPMPQMDDQALEQPLVQPVEPPIHDTPQQEVDRRPGMPFSHEIRHIA